MSVTTWVYAAGGFDSAWRRELQQRWADRGVHIIDPFVESRQASLAEFTLDDLSHVDRASLVFVYTDYERYTGTALEVGYAYAKGIPIVFATTLGRVDSMMAACARAVFTDLNAAAEYAERNFLPPPSRTLRERLRGGVGYPDP